MKKNNTLLIFLALLMTGCAKNNGGNGGTGGGGTGGGNTPPMTITGFSPTHPYLDDTLIITGTGFNPDKTKDTVLFSQDQTGAILKASSTQLVLKFPHEYDLDLGMCNCQTFYLSAAGQKKMDTGYIAFKRTLALGVITDLDYHNINVGRPGDSLVFGGQGFTTHGLSISIDGVSLTGMTVDSAYNCAAVLRLPKTIFGENNSDTAGAYKNVTVSNADGKMAQKVLPFALSPTMEVYDMEPDHSAYSIAGLNNNGGKISIKIHGRNLKSDCSMHLDGSSDTKLENPLQVSGFPDSTVVQYGTGGLSSGNYQVSLWRGNTLFGTCFFQLNP